MCLFIPWQMKIVSIESTREVNIHNPTGSGLTRQGFGGESSEGEIGEFELLKAALRERPEYIIVGEIRGAEAYVLFQAMATGHCSYSTVHADSYPASSTVWKTNRLTFHVFFYRLWKRLRFKFRLELTDDVFVEPSNWSKSSVWTHTAKK